MEHPFGHQQRGVADVKLQDGVVEKHGDKLTGVQQMLEETVNWKGSECRWSWVRDAIVNWKGSGC